MLPAAPSPGMPSHAVRSAAPHLGVTAARAAAADRGAARAMAGMRIAAQVMAAAATTRRAAPVVRFMGSPQAVRAQLAWARTVGEERRGSEIHRRSAKVARLRGRPASLPVAAVIGP